MISDKNLQVLDDAGLETLVEKIRHMFNEEIGNLSTFEVIGNLKNTAELPNIGSAKAIYVITNEDGDVMYRWDNDEMRYIIMGTNYNNIEIIRGGNANTWNK